MRSCEITVVSNLKRNLVCTLFMQYLKENRKRCTINSYEFMFQVINCFNYFMFAGKKINKNFSKYAIN